MLQYWHSIVYTNTLYTIQYTLYTIQYTVLFNGVYYILYCTVYSIHRSTVYTISSFKLLDALLMCSFTLKKQMELGIENTHQVKSNFFLYNSSCYSKGYVSYCCIQRLCHAIFVVVGDTERLLL